MGLFDSLFNVFGRGALMWSHGDLEAVDIIPPLGATISAVDAIKGDERWETVTSGNGQRRRRAAWWSVKTEAWPTPAVRSRIKQRSTNEIWEVRELISRDANFIRVDCVLIAAHEFVKVRGE